MCDVLVYSHEEGCVKPDPALYRIVCDRPRCPPERCVLVDDTKRYIDALAVGMHGVKLTDSEQAIRDVGQVLSGGSVSPGLG
jgi:FMN phosphatase YigB (HAD superfamily)